MLDFNQNMEGLIAEIVSVLPEFQAIRVERLRVSASFAQSRTRRGLLAYLLPLKYKDGRPFERRVRGKAVYHYGMLPQFHNGNELLYIVYFVLPRFLNLSLKEKLETVVHELYHVSPFFNGDVRRLRGRSYLHGQSMRAYDQRIAGLTQQFLSLPHRESAYAFLRGNFHQVERRFGGVEAQHIVEPKPTLLKVAKLGVEIPRETQMEFRF